LHAPFNNKKLRQAILHAVDQSDYMSAVVGPDPAMFRTANGVFTPGTPFANTAGLEPLTGKRDFDLAKRLMKEAGYNGERTRLIGPTDILAPSALTQVAGDMFRRLDFNMDFALSDWGTVIQRRASQEPVEKNGWSALCTSFASFDFIDPAGHSLLRGNGTAGWFGWPTIPRLEQLRADWFAAPDLAAQKTICMEIQRVAMDEVAYIPVGAYLQGTALRTNLQGRVEGLALLWNLRRV
jgi:peptide/nickel transport system substrate-binding protein